jgi:hypothetical protein
LKDSLRDREQDKFRPASDDLSKVAVTDETTALFTAIDEVSKNLSYFGFAAIGSSQAAAVWKITRLQKTGNVTLLQYADGNESFDNIWNNRASLSYS